MTTSPHQDQPLSRRRLLCAAGLAGVTAWIGAATPGRSEPAGAEAGCSAVIPRKSSQHDSRFVAQSRSSRNCGNCRFFQQPGQCLVVEGAVGPESACSLWAQRGGALGCVPDGPIRL